METDFHGYLGGWAKNIEDTKYMIKNRSQKHAGCVSHMHSMMQDNGTIKKGLGILGNKKKNDRIRPKNHHLGFSWNHYLAIKIEK